MRLKKGFCRILVITLVLTLSINFIFAAAITDDIHLNLQTTFTNGTIQAGTFDFVFNISTTDTCDNIIYTNSTTLTTDSRGIISYYLPNVTLDYDEQYYLCYYRDSVLKDSSQIARIPYAFRAQNITLSGVEIDSDLNMGAYNITTTGTGFFGFLGSLVNRATKLFVIDLDFTGRINGTGNITTTGNITAEYIGVGTTSPSQRLDVDGAIQIGTTDTAEAGVIRWTGTQFQAYNGTDWNSFGSVGGGSLWSQTGGDIYYNEGFVGIGTISPIYNLDVVGNASISENLTVGGNITFGGAFSAGNISGSGAVLNEQTSSTNPTLIPSKAALGYGIGYGSSSVHLIAGDTNVLEVTLSQITGWKPVNFTSNVTFGSDSGDILSGNLATSAALLNEPASSTNPTLIPSKAALGYGIGYGSQSLHLIANDENIVEVTGLEVSFNENVSMAKNLSVDGSTLFVDSNNDKVGIGTTSPQSTLNVVGDANVTGFIIMKLMNVTVEQNGDVNVW